MIPRVVVEIIVPVQYIIRRIPCREQTYKYFNELHNLQYNEQLFNLYSEIQSPKIS